MKDVIWLADSLEVLSNFPDQAKHNMGVELMRIQSGLNPISFRPMPTVGAGVCEIKVKHRGEYRIMYVAKFKEAIYVISSFHKKGQKTPKLEFELAKGRYKRLVADRATQ